jgi:AcrR family transcriptional regulator
VVHIVNVVNHRNTVRAPWPRGERVGVAERRDREREEVRRKILDAARELFTAEGYERVTMRRIAEAIEYSPTAIYNHFQDKDSLLNALCEDEFSQLLAVMGSGPPPGSGVAWIRQLGLAYARFGLRYPNHYRFMFMAAAAFDEERRPSAPGEQAFELVRSAVKKAIDSGEFRKADVDEVAQVLWSSLHGAVALLITFRAHQFPGAPPRPDLVERVVENGIRGFLAPRTRPTRPRKKRR